MRAVAHLVWTYFTAMPLMRGLALAGLAVSAVAAYALNRWAFWTVAMGQSSEMSLFNQVVIVLSPWVGLLLVFFSSSLLPLMFDRLAFSRQLHVLPGGRGRLLASILVTTALIALLAAVLAVLAFRDYPFELDLLEFFFETLVIATVNFSLIYLAMWVLGQMRSAFGLLVGAMLVLASVFFPMGSILGPEEPMRWPVYSVIAAWTLLGIGFLSARRLSRLAGGLRSKVSEAAERILPPASFAAGKQRDLLLATDRPWIVALGQIVPISAASGFIFIESTWLFAMAVFCALSGAVTSTAASRARRLWLRSDRTRQQLFREVEKACLKYNGFAWIVLIAFFIGVGLYRDLGERTMAFGIPLILLGGLASSYLGLMMTKGLGWLESVLLVGTMILIGLAGIFAIDLRWPVVWVLWTEAALAILAVLYRIAARDRWQRLDWMVCAREAPAEPAR